MFTVFSSTVVPFFFFFLLFKIWSFSWLWTNFGEVRQNANIQIPKALSVTPQYCVLANHAFFYWETVCTGQFLHFLVHPCQVTDSPASGSQCAEHPDFTVGLTAQQVRRLLRYLLHYHFLSLFSSYYISLTLASFIQVPENILKF